MLRLGKSFEARGGGIKSSILVKDVPLFFFVVFVFVCGGGLFHGFFFFFVQQLNDWK